MGGGIGTGSGTGIGAGTGAGDGDRDIAIGGLNRRAMSRFQLSRQLPLLPFSVPLLYSPCSSPP